MHREILLLVMVSTVTPGCGWRPGVYAVPPQRSLDLGPEPGGLAAFITMEDSTAPNYIVRDISPERGLRRWAFVHPELRFRVRQPGHLIFVAEFALPEVTFKVTGPVTVSCSVNGRALTSLRCNHAGDYRLEAPVPDGLIDPAQEAHVTFEASPRWISPEDGAQLSFFLRSAGFLPAGGATQ